jgi:hypothetical protein
VVIHGESLVPAAGLNLTCIFPSSHAGALYIATSGFSVGVTTASVPVTREFAVAGTTAEIASVASKLSLTLTMIW